MNDIYKDAFAEVYSILEWLDESDYEKIPKDVIQAIEENRNKDYFYELNTDIDLIEQPMLPETKAILFNLFRDYLSTTEQRINIKRRQNEERMQIERIKASNSYQNDVFGHSNTNVEFERNNFNSNQLMEVKKQNLLQKIFIKIKNIFCRKDK